MVGADLLVLLFESWSNQLGTPYHCADRLAAVFLAAGVNR